MELNFGPFNAPSAENSPLDLPFTPKRIKVKQEQASTATHTLNSSGSASRSEHPCSPPEAGNSACSDTSTDCWITAVIPNHHDYSNIPTSSKPDASSECIMATAGTGTLCSEPTGHVQSPMQELATLLTGCPPQLHAAFMHTAVALAEQSERAKEELMQQLLLAQQGCGDLNTEQLQQLLQQQQAQRYSLIPIVALPMLLAAAQPHWCGADISYAALQIRCHLNVVANFQVDTPIAADTRCTAAGGGGSLAAEPVAHSDANVTATDFASSSSSSSSSNQKQQQQQQHECHYVSVDPPCDLMYAELASTILAAAATEAAVSEQQLPQAVQALLLDFTAELSSTPELQDKLQQAFAQAATATAAAAAVQRVNTGLGSQGTHVISSSAGGLSSSSSSNSGAEEPFEDRLPVVKAVKVLCKLLVGAAGLSDIRLLAWLTCLVRQQHLDNHHSFLQHTSPADGSSAAGPALLTEVSSPTTASTTAAAAAEAASDAALISCSQLLEILGQLVQGLGGSDEPCLHHTEGLQSLLTHGLDGHPCPGHTQADCCWGGSFSCWAHGDHRQEQQQDLIPDTQELGVVWHQGASISDTSGPGWMGAGTQRRRARCNYRSSISSVSSEGWPDDCSSSFYCSPEGLDIRETISEDGEGDGCSSTAHRDGRASLSHQLSSSRPHYGIYSSVGRAAHRPLSISGSLGDGVPDYMAAAAAAGHLAAASFAPVSACTAPQQQRGNAAAAPCSTQRMLRHQETWPGKASTSSGCRAFTRSSSSNSSSTYRKSRLSRLSLPGTALGGLECSSRVCGSWGLDNSRRSSSRAIWALEDGTLQPSPNLQRCSQNHHQQQQQLQHMYSLQEQERIAQQQAWQHEMKLEHQPWEGAVSPVAASSTNWAFGGCQAGSTTVLYSRTDSSSDSRARVVDILRISSSSGSYRSPCFSDSAAQDQ